MRTNVQLAANTLTRFAVQGRFLQIVSTGAASSVTLKIEWNGNLVDVEEVGDVENYFRVRAGDTQHFSAIYLQSSVLTTLDLLVSWHDVSVSPYEGATVQLDATQIPLEVVKKATAITDNAAANMTDAAASIIAASATRRRIVFRNTGSNPVALGAAGITWAKRAIVINPDESWVEDDAPNLQWFGICNTGLTSTVTAQAVTE